MRVLSAASDVPAVAPLRHDTTKEASLIVNGETGTTSPRTSTAVTCPIPTVALDTDAVSDNMAARLCTSFLGHVLFLKNQVPFPVVQLARMPTNDNTSRAAKKRHELLNSFDTLASHLYTTFVALSTAMALRGTPERAQEGTEARLLQHQNHGLARVFFVVALGPTVGTAKSRIIVSIDGLETKVWGLGENGSHEVTRIPNVLGEGVDDSSESVSNIDDDYESEECEDEERHASSEEGDASESDVDESPPLSRSPSPGLSNSDSSTPRRAEDHETIRAAERLLSRTLASACAEGDGQGLAAEMAPTQVHILLRAPRRFDHPSWIPRQSLCTSLDGYLADFLEESGQAPISCDAVAKKRTKRGKVQGVWIKSRGGIAQTQASEQDLAEEDEMIWWSWDGKLVGFSDW